MKSDALELQHGPNLGWGSDIVAEILRQLGVEYNGDNPGSSLHSIADELVYLSDQQPPMLLSLHEQSLVAIAPGYCGKPVARGASQQHRPNSWDDVDLRAWRDRIPMLILGATGGIDAAVRRKPPFGRRSI